MNIKTRIDLWVRYMHTEVIPKDLVLKWLDEAATDITSVACTDCEHLDDCEEKRVLPNCVASKLDKWFGGGAEKK